MRLRNRDGSAVDPIPFVVIAGLGCMVLLSFGPIYVRALGASLSNAIAVSIALSAVFTAAAYYRYVWTTRPELHGHVSGTVRAKRLFYLMVALAVIIVGLSLPFLVNQ